jgi:hypothetical protein
MIRGDTFVWYKPHLLVVFGVREIHRDANWFVVMNCERAKGLSPGRATLGHAAARWTLASVGLFLALLKMRLGIGEGALASITPLIRPYFSNLGHVTEASY